MDDLILSTLGQNRDEALISSNSLEQHVYLDYAGCPPISKSLLADVFHDLSHMSYTNPHSYHRTHADPTADAMSSYGAMQAARSMTLQHFGLSDEYEVIFTSGATASIKMVADIFPWTKNSELLYAKNAHNSLMGMRSLAPRYVCMPVHPLYAHANAASSSTSSTSDVSDISSMLCGLDIGSINMDAAADADNKMPFSLLALPGECNFSGARLNYQQLTNTLDVLQGTSSNQWLWLLDAAKLAASSDLALHKLSPTHRPHFIAISYYKIFGYPTGIGALLVKKECMKYMNKRYFGGGTLQAGAADSAFLAPRSKESHEHYEDGTANFHGIAALRHGFNFIGKLGGMEKIEAHAHSMFSYLLHRMVMLQHADGLPLCIFYSHADLTSLSAAVQGPVITFNLQWQDAVPIGYAEVQNLATAHHIYMRTGCFCNLGGCQDALGISAQLAETHYALGKVCSGSNEELDIINNMHTGACRVSLGYGTTKADCDAFVSFLQACFLDKASPQSLLAMQSVALADTSVAGEGALDMQKMYWQQTVYTFPSSCTPVPDANAIGDGSCSIQALYVYPIKSCAGVRVDHWPITSQGLLFDRSYAIINDQTGAVLTQKQCPRLALVKPSFYYDSSSKVWSMHVTAMGYPMVLEVLLMDSGSASQEEKVVRICGRCSAGKLVSSDASKWFTEYINSTAEQDKRGKHTYSLLHNATSTSSSSQQSYANSAQYLMLSIQSVRALIEMMMRARDTAAEGEEKDMESIDNIKVENFRPNIVINNADNIPHLEDSYHSLRVPLSFLDAGLVKADMDFAVTGPCARCLMVNVNSGNGKTDCKVFEALRSYRYAERSVFFGQFLALDAASYPALVSCADIDMLPRLVVGTSIAVTKKERSS